MGTLLATFTVLLVWWCRRWWRSRVVVQETERQVLIKYGMFSVALVSSFAFFAHEVSAFSAAAGGGWSAFTSLLLMAEVLVLLVVTFADGFERYGLSGPDGRELGVGKQCGRSPDNVVEKRLAALYFSVVTITTVGYGDVVPASRMSRLLAGMLAIDAYLTLAILVSSTTHLLVG